MRFRVASALALGCLLLSGCASYKAARPTVVCGTTVGFGGPGVEVLDVWASPASPPGAPAPLSLSEDVAAGVLVRVSDSCKTGAAVTFPSAGPAVMDPVARARDGRPVVFGVASRPGEGAVSVTVTVTKGRGVRILHMLTFPAPAASSRSTAPSSSP